MFSNFLKRKKLYLFMAALVFYFACIPADIYAMPVASGTSSLKSARLRDYEDVASVIELTVIKKRLLKLGLREEEIKMKLSSLSDEQLRLLAQKAEAIEIGSGSGAVIGLGIFLFLIFLYFLFTTHDIIIEPKEKK